MINKPVHRARSHCTTCTELICVLSSDILRDILPCGMCCVSCQHHGISNTVARSSCATLPKHVPSIATVSTHFTSLCGSGPVSKTAWSPSRTTACGGAGNIAYGPLMAPSCTTGSSWAAVQYPLSLAVVAAWDMRTATIWGAQWQCNEPYIRGVQQRAYEGMTSSLKKYIKSSCVIGYHTAGTPQC